MGDPFTLCQVGNDVSLPWLDQCDAFSPSARMASAEDVGRDGRPSRPRGLRYGIADAVGRPP
jgi:hypothetical protein